MDGGCCLSFTPMMSFFVKNALEAGNVEFFKKITEDKTIREIVARPSEPTFSASRRTFFELTLEKEQWELCKFFATNSLWEKYTMNQFFQGEKLNKNLFTQYYRLALKYNDSVVDLRIIFNPGATRNGKEFLRKLYKLAKENNNQDYQSQIRILMKKNNSKREEKLKETLLGLGLFNEERLNTFVLEYLDSMELPGYKPEKFNIF